MIPGRTPAHWEAGRRGTKGEAYLDSGAGVPDRGAWLGDRPASRGTERPVRTRVNKPTRAPAADVEGPSEAGAAWLPSPPSRPPAPGHPPLCGTSPAGSGDPFSARSTASSPLSLLSCHPCPQPSLAALVPWRNAQSHVIAFIPFSLSLFGLPPNDPARNPHPPAWVTAGLQHQQTLPRSASSP